MGNRPVRFDKFEKEFELLKRTWFEMFVEGDDAEVDGKLELHHPPPGFKQLVDEILDEGTEGLHEMLDKHEANGWTDEQMSSYSYNVLLQLARISAIRFYRMGQALAETMPWDSLTPCGCTAIQDEDLYDLLSAPFELEGEGWVIKDFKTRKEER